MKFNSHTEQNSFDSFEYDVENSEEKWRAMGKWDLYVLFFSYCLSWIIIIIITLANKKKKKKKHEFFRSSSLFLWNSWSIGSRDHTRTTRPLEKCCATAITTAKKNLIKMMGGRFLSLSFVRSFFSLWGGKPHPPRVGSSSSNNNNSASRV